MLTPYDEQGGAATQTPAAIDYPRDATVHELFAAQAALSPEATALLSATRRMTYAELDAQSNALASSLIRSGVKPGDIVAVLIGRSADATIALLGILKSGAAFAPLDPSYPKQQIAHMLEDCRPAAVVVRGQDFAALLKELNCDCPILDTAHLIAAGVSRQHDGSVHTVGPCDPAYVMFTSGSTGRPKGVVVPHRAIVRLVKGNNFAALSDAETILQLAPLAFDASTLEIWGALLNGGRLAFAKSESPSLAGISEAIRDCGVTTLWLTAGLFHLMVERELEGLRPLKQLLAGGDVLSPSHVEKARLALPSCQLINGYGPTENTTFTCCYPIPRESPVTGPLPIGYPLRQTTVLVLDEQMQPVARGEPGQLCAGGDGLALGYLNRPELTAEKFVLDPTDPTGQSRLYLTGDLVREREDGCFEYLGRIDRQVKINGKRVELEEVEIALRQFQGIQDAVVGLRELPQGGKQLAAYLVAPAAVADDLEALRAFLRDILPEHAVPQVFGILDEFPLLPTGKVDRKALAVLPITSARASNSASNSLEHEIAKLWAGALSQPNIDVATNFFDLGGTSLQMVKIHSQIQQTLCATLGMEDMFTYPTIRALAEHIQGGSRARSTPSASFRAEKRAQALMQAREAQRASALARQAEARRLPGRNAGSSRSEG